MSRTESIEPRSDGWYVAHKGLACPYCTSMDLEGEGLLDAEGATAWQNIKCNYCGMRWQDLYNLTGFSTEFTEGNDEH